MSVPSQTRGLPPLASTEIPLPGAHQLFGAANIEEPYVPSEAMDHDDIHTVIEQFTTAAKNAVEAGFDGIEIHGETRSNLLLEGV